MPAAFQGSKRVRGGLKRTEYQVKARYQVRANACYAGERTYHCILFIFSPICEYIHLAYVRVHVIYRANQAEYIIHIRAVVPQEYVNTYSTCRRTTLKPLRAVVFQKSPGGYPCRYQVYAGGKVTQ